MANIDWDTQPATANTDTWANYTAYLRNRDDHLGTMDYSVGVTDSDIPTGFIQFVVASNKFQRWSGSAWVDIVLSVAGGGTALTSVGDMISQNANAIAITGGTIAGLTSLSLSGSITFAADGTYSIGTSSAQGSMAYFKNGLKIPVGTDKWAT